MPMRVTVRITGLTETDRRLNKLGREMYQFRGAMLKIGSRLKSYYKNEAWNSRGGVFKSKWPELKPRTIAQKKRLGYRNVRPMERTGAMRDSFGMSTTDNSVTIENRAPYFKYHQSTAPRRIIPYRPMMGINSDVEDIVKDEIEADIRQKLDSAS